MLIRHRLAQGVRQIRGDAPKVWVRQLTVGAVKVCNTENVGSTALGSTIQARAGRVCALFKRSSGDEASHDSSDGGKSGDSLHVDRVEGNRAG